MLEASAGIDGAGAGQEPAPTSGQNRRQRAPLSAQMADDWALEPAPSVRAGASVDCNGHNSFSHAYLDAAAHRVRVKLLDFNAAT